MSDKQISGTASPLALGAVGDAYGFCFEFAPDEFVKEKNNLRYHQHPTFTVKPGAYSDDTQMQMALAELILAGKEWTPEIIAQNFIDTFKRDERQGYGRRFFKFLKSVESGEEFMKKIRPESERNGAAMRAPVIGMLPDIDEVKEKSRVQAAVTHDTKGGRDSAVASSLLCHYFAYRLGSKRDAPNFLEAHLPDHDWTTPWEGHIPVHGIITVRAAVTAITQTESLSDLLKSCISFTGDTDSVATIALACASGSEEFKRDLPQRLWDDIEDSEFGISYLRELDGRLRDAIAGGI
jgi:ADP-ribosyl-[dinitrogen reductase] hydrolase